MYDIEQRFTVKNLKAVCGTLGQHIGGTKGVLQQRLRSHFESILEKKDAVRFSIGKGVVESERGLAYNSNRPTGGGAYNRPNGYDASSSPSKPTVSSAPNAWGMSNLYANIRLRMLPPGLL